MLAQRLIQAQFVAEVETNMIAKLKDVCVSCYKGLRFIINLDMKGLSAKVLCASSMAFVLNINYCFFEKLNSNFLN